jgi:hypothetical protein
MSGSKASVPEAAITRWLRELPNCVVLRNEQDLFGHLQRGGDVDVLVGDLEFAERTLIRHLGPPIRTLKSSYVRGYSYEWGHVDLLPTIEWRGARFLSTAAVLEHSRLSATGRSVPRIAHEALISWLTNVLFGGFFKERYAADIRRAVEIDGSTFQRMLTLAAGPKWGGRLWQVAADGTPEISADWARNLRQAVWWRAFWRSPAGTMRGFIAFVLAELKLRFQPAVPWIAIIGSDGGRQSALTDEIGHRFTACPYGTVKAFHWRPRPVGRAQAMEITDPHRSPSGAPTGSGLRALVLAADWFASYWTRLVHLRAKGYILAFDRTYIDLFVEHQRDSCGTGPRLARALWWLIPKPDLVFLLDSQTAVVGGDASAVPGSALERQRHGQSASVDQRPNRHVLDGSLPLSILLDDIQGVIREWMLDRSLAILGAMPAPAGTRPSRRA